MKVRDDLVKVLIKKLDDGTCSCCLQSDMLEMHTIQTEMGEYNLVYCRSCEQLAGSLIQPIKTNVVKA